MEATTITGSIMIWRKGMKVARQTSLHLVAPELRALLELYPTVPLEMEGVSALRLVPSPEPLPAPAPQPVVQMIPGWSENPDVRVVIIGADPGGTARPGYLHMHGGGYLFGSPEFVMPTLQGYAAEVGCVVVSVDYRLAPETQFPGSLDDNYAALTWLHDNAASLGVDPSRIAVGGESAGGGHAAALAIAARDRNGPPISFQYLVCPMLDDRTGSSREVSPFLGEFGWTAAHNRFGWTALLGVAAGDEVPHGAVPARVQDLSGLPPTFVGCSSLDLFVEENLSYASRLMAAGVPCEVHIEAGGFHGFNFMVPEAEVSKRFNAHLIDALKRGLAGPTS